MDDAAQMHRKSGRFGLIEAGSAFGSGNSAQLHPGPFQWLGSSSQETSKQQEMFCPLGYLEDSFLFFFERRSHHVT